jgi:hypothetical protein
VTAKPLLDRARFALAAFVAVICVTTLSPFMHLASGEMVCSVQGTKVIVQSDVHTLGDRGHDTSDDHAAHCPLCMPAGAPPTLIVWNASPVQPLDHALQTIPAALLASLVGAPFPARGPPLVS